MTKFAIGCLVQWYESEIIGYYLLSLKDAIEQYSGEVLVDICLVTNTELESPTSESDLNSAVDKISELCKGYANFRITSSLVTIADYRRKFNSEYSTIADVLVWGESDMLVPKEMFNSLDQLHQAQASSTPKYLATFGICKMWDNSWKPLEHVDFTDKPFIEGDIENWWSVRYSMSIEEMNKINEKVDNVELTLIQPHKFNGCGLVISAEVVKAGVNIPQSVFFIHEDTAFMLMTQKVLGNIPQYHFKNILLVHNRKHPNKRSYIKGEENIDKTDTGALRKAHSWYQKANKMSEENCYNIFNPYHKAKTWEDVWK